MSAYLSRTNSSAGNRRTLTWSFWIKFSRGPHANYGAAEEAIQVYGDAQSGYPSHRLSFHDGKAHFYSADDAAQNGKMAMESGDIRFKDPSAWYHFVYMLDTTAGSAATRQRVWVNGIEAEVNGNGGWVRTDAGQNHDTDHNGTETEYIGKYHTGSYFDGQIADYYFLDGVSKIHTDFGQFDSTSGIWKPKAYSGSFGTNGFHLKGENAGNIGLDSSGNSNNWTVNGTNVYQSVDTPSNNFCTLNYDLSNKADTGKLTYGGLTTNNYANSYTTSQVGSTMGIAKGKWYYETKVSGTGGIFEIGWAVAGAFKSQNKYNLLPGDQDDNSSWMYRGTTNSGLTGYNKLRHDNADVIATFGATNLSSGDVVMCAIDIDNGKMWWGVNGTWYDGGSGTGNPATGAYAHATFTANPSGEGNAPIFYMPHTASSGVAGDMELSLNFGATGRFKNTAFSSAQNDNAGNGTFEYSPPSGYYSICTANIATYG